MTDDVFPFKAHGHRLTPLPLCSFQLFVAADRHDIAKDFNHYPVNRTAEGSQRNYLSYIEFVLHSTIVLSALAGAKKKSSEIYPRPIDLLPRHAISFPWQEEANMAEEGKSAAYVSWVTFKNSMDKLSEGMPNRIDKTVFPGLSGGTLVQLLPALKFLGLTRDDGTPTETLQALVQKNELDRKEDLRQIFHACYPELFSLDLTKATPSQLAEKMSAHYGVTGSTLLKATRFFLNGAVDLGIPLSKYLATKGTGNGGGSRRRITRKQKPAPAAVVAAVSDIPTTSATTSKTIRLETEGMTLTLIVPGNFGELTSSDRKFVFELMDKLEVYEEAKAGPEDFPSGQSQTDEGREE
jgi:hypothetical protein